jgi:FkbM family methyltransferase
MKSSADGVLFLGVTWRNPFSFVKSNRLLDLYRLCAGDYQAANERQSLDVDPSLIEGLSASQKLKLYKLVSGLALPQQGVAEFRNENRSRGTQFRFDSKNTQFHSIYFASYKYGYEHALCALIDKLIPSDGVFLDIGSNWGHLSFYLASRKGFKGSITGFEPNPGPFRDFCALKRKFGLSSRIAVKNCGLSDRSRKASIHMPDGVHSGTAQVSAATKGTKGEVPIVLSTLDSFKNFQRIDFIKLDVEGHEPEALRGGRKTLSRTRPYIVFESSTNTDKANALKTMVELENSDYSLFMLAWAHIQDNGEALIHRMVPETAMKGTMALVPISAKTRMIFPGYLNLFAVPREKLAQLGGS